MLKLLVHGTIGFASQRSLLNEYLYDIVPVTSTKIHNNCSCFDAMDLLFLVADSHGFSDDVPSPHNLFSS
jgi:hypothetical protein